MAERDVTITLPYWAACLCVLHLERAARKGAMHDEPAQARRQMDLVERFKKKLKEAEAERVGVQVLSERTNGVED